MLLSPKKRLFLIAAKIATYWKAGGGGGWLPALLAGVGGGVLLSVGLLSAGALAGRRLAGSGVTTSPGPLSVVSTNSGGLASRSASLGASLSVPYSPPPNSSSTASHVLPKRARRLPATGAGPFFRQLAKPATLKLIPSAISWRQADTEPGGRVAVRLTGRE